MALICVNYDLSIDGPQNYKGVEEVLAGYPDGCRILQSLWVIDTEDTTQQVQNKLRRRISKTDSVFVCQVDDDSWWSSYGLNDEAMHWLNSHSKKTAGS
jgi:hypothetical protein